jgi:hypothetical protein
LLLMDKSFQNKRQSRRAKNKRRQRQLQRPLNTVFPANYPSSSELYNIQYVDFISHISSTTTTNPISMLNAFLSVATGIFPAQPSLGRLTTVGQAAADVFRYQALLRITRIDLRVRWVGSQSNTIVAGDLFNTGRVAIFTSGENYSNASITLFTTVDDIPDMRDNQIILHDKTVGLSSTAFDSSSNYNVPRVLCYSTTIPCDLCFKVYSTDSTGSLVWDTQYGDLLYQSVSDSSVAPNPQLFVNARMYYTIVQS